MQDAKPILCLDFDGVCHSYTSGWKGAVEIPDPPVDGLFEFLLRANEYFDINIFSSRSHQEGGIEAMRTWLEHYFFVWQADVGHEGELPPISFPTTKPAAMVTLDDRGLLFEGTWPDIDALRAFKPWNKKG